MAGITKANPRDVVKAFQKVAKELGCDQSAAVSGGAFCPGQIQTDESSRKSFQVIPEGHA